MIALVVSCDDAILSSSERSKTRWCNCFL